MMEKMNKKFQNKIQRAKTVLYCQKKFLKNKLLTKRTKLKNIQSNGKNYNNVCCKTMTLTRKD